MLKAKIFKEYKFLLIILILYMVSYGLHFNGLKHDFPTNIDNYYGLTRSIVENGTLIRNEVLDICAKRPTSFACNDTEAISLGTNNKIYSRFPPGISFLGVPFYFIPYILGFRRSVKLASLVFLNTLLSIALLLFIYKIARIYLTRRNSKKITYIFAFGTIIYTYSQAFSSDILAALLVIISFYYFLKFLKDKKNKYVFLSGLPLGYIYLTKPPLIFIPFILLLLYLYLSIKDKNFKYCLIFIISFSILFFIGGMYYYSAFGGFLKTGYSSTIDIKKYAETGVLETYDEFGFFNRNALIQGPVILLGILITSPFLIFSLTRFKKFENKAVYLILILTLILFGSFSSPFGAWCFGPRYQLYMISLLIIPLASNFNDINQNKIKKKLFWILVILAIIINIIGSLNFVSWELWTEFNNFISRISKFK